MSLAAMTFLPNLPYVIVVFIGFLIAGLGIGMYATPSLDTSLAYVEDDKAGIASGIYKMASSLGYLFGLAISTAIYSTVEVLTSNLELAASSGMLSALVFGGLSLWIVTKKIEPSNSFTSNDIVFQTK